MPVKRASQKPEPKDVFGQQRNRSKMFRAGLYARVSRTMRLSAVLAIASITGTTKSASADQQLTAVEIWCLGDDGLTLRLRDTVEHALRSSSSFRLSSGKKPGTLLVTIPTNVGWKQLGKKTRVFYEVTFSTVDGKNLGEKKGSCWSDHLEGCAASILQSAKSAARSIH